MGNLGLSDTRYINMEGHLLQGTNRIHVPSNLGLIISPFPSTFFDHVVTLFYP